MKISDQGIEKLKNKENTVLDRYGNHVVYDDRTGKPVNPPPIAQQKIPRTGDFIIFAFVAVQSCNPSTDDLDCMFYS